MSTVKVGEIQHPSNSNTSVSIASDSSVALKHSGNQKLVTSSTGVSITGTCTATSFSGDGSALSPAPADTTKMPLAGGTFTGEVIFQKEITETVYQLTTTASGDTTRDLDPSNGTIQTLILGINSTVTANNFDTGQSMLLIVTASSSNYTLTWPTMKWRGGSDPTLGGSDPTAIELFKVGSQLYGATVGDLS